MVAAELPYHRRRNGNTLRAREWREARGFGLTVGGVLVVAGGWWLFRGRFPSAAPWVLGTGALLLILALAAPAALLIPARLWMRFAEALSWVMTRLILFLVFYLVVTPIGLLRRLMGGDPLRRRAAPAPSYWRPYPARQRDPKHYEKMY
jgi:hypothetical protein